MPIPDGFVPVPAGEFIYGSEVTYERLELAPPARLRQKMWLADFWIAIFPVTYREWQIFLEDTGHSWPGRWWRIRRGPAGWLRRFAPCAEYPPEMAEYPMVDVTLADALAYCAWLSERWGVTVTLPTEFQWEKAARGVDGRTFPWGEAHPRPELADLPATHSLGLNYYQRNLLIKPKTELARSGWYWRVGSPLPVGAIPQNVSPFGAVDMAGNIWEWTLSLYNDRDPRFHVVKGGSWGYSPQHTACNCRSACSITIPSVDYHAQGTGFRLILNDE